MKRSSRNGSGQCILYELLTAELKCGKRVIESVAVVETGMDKRGGDGDCCCVVQEVTNTTEVTYVVVTRTRERKILMKSIAYKSPTGWIEPYG